MRIESGNQGFGMQAWTPQGADMASKTIQRQIREKQEELQKLSENEGMSPEEKMKKGQEIRQEIMELNRQLSQHETEARKEKSGGETSEGSMQKRRWDRFSKSGEGQDMGLSQADMKSLISADCSVKQAGVQNSVAKDLEGRARILENEIKLEKGGLVAERKAAELEEVKEKASAAASLAVKTLKEADGQIFTENKEEEEAVKEQDPREEDEMQDALGTDEENAPVHSADGE